MCVCVRACVCVSACACARVRARNLTLLALVPLNDDPLTSNIMNNLAAFGRNSGRWFSQSLRSFCWHDLEQHMSLRVNRTAESATATAEEYRTP